MASHSPFTHRFTQFTPRGRRRLAVVSLSSALLLGAAACGSTASSGTSEAPGSDASVSAELASQSAASGFWDSSAVHDIDVTFEDEAYDEMVTAYMSTGDKGWISASVTIDGTTYEEVGLRLKGNSSLRGLTTETAQNPEALPWLIRLDKFVDDQAHEGVNDIVIRSNSTESAMNEAVALELLGSTGLATEEAVATSFTVNDGTSELRLAIENPDSVWDAANFDADGLLYKADSEGDYSYRGDDATAYEDVFDQEVGDDDLEPLTDFLQFINESDDETFAAELSSRLDVDGFATYLAFQELIGNFDDIDGPGNNSYLRYDLETEQFTVVNWDLNLAFNTANVGGSGASGGAAGGAGGPGAGGRPGGPPAQDDAAAEDPTAVGEVPAGAPAPADAPDGGGGGGAPSNGNILSERFMANDEFSQMVDEATSELTEVLFTDGTADQILATWTTVLQSDAGDLIDSATVEADATAIRAQFPTS